MGQTTVFVCGDIHSLTFLYVIYSINDALAGRIYDIFLFYFGRLWFDEIDLKELFLGENLPPKEK